jgi:hypothetical protein
MGGEAAASGGFDRGGTSGARIAKRARVHDATESAATVSDAAQFALKVSGG